MDTTADVPRLVGVGRATDSAGRPLMLSLGQPTEGCYSGYDKLALTRAAQFIRSFVVCLKGTINQFDRKDRTINF